MSQKILHPGTQLVQCNHRAVPLSRKVASGHKIRSVPCRAQQRDDPFRTRLAVNLTSVPYRIDNYFQYSFWRKALWSGSAFSAGYYAANTVSLSFGALAINDVIAAAVTVGFCEVVSILYWSAETPGLGLLFLNCFKLGVIAALIADAFKLAG